MSEDEVLDISQEQVTIPTIVQEAATSAQLGDFRKVYPFVTESIKKNLAFHSGCLGIGILLVLCGIAGIGHTGLLPYFVAAIPIGLSSLWLLLDFYEILFKPNLRREYSIYEFEDGIVSLKAGDRVEVFPWTQIAFFWKDVTYKVNPRTIGKLWVPQMDDQPNLPMERTAKLGQDILYEPIVSGRYKIQGYSDRSPALTIHRGYTDNVELGTRIENKIFDRLLSQAKQDLEQERVVLFGYFSISQHHICAGEKVLSWEQVDEFSVSDGEVTIKQRGESLKWASREVSDIPNFAVFRKLVEAMLQRYQSPSSVKKRNRRLTRKTSWG